MLYKIHCKFIFILLFLFLLRTHALYPQITEETSDYNYGKELFADNLYDLASIQFNEFLVKYPSSPKVAEVSFLLAESYFFADKIIQAKNFYIKFIINFPSDEKIPQVYYRIGECYEKSDLIQEAIVSYLRLRNTTSDTPWYFKGLLKAVELSLELKRYQQAESLLITIIHSEPQGEFITQTWMLYSQFYYATDNYKKSIEALQTLLSKSISQEEECRVLLKLGDIYKNIGFLQKSKDYYSQIINNYDLPAIKQKAYYKLGMINKLQGNSVISQDNFQKSLEIPIDTTLFIEASLKLADLNSRENNFNKSLAYYKSVIEIDSTNHVAKFGKAFTLKNMQDYSLSSTLFSQLLQDVSLSENLKKKVLLHSAFLSYQQNAISEMINYMDRYITEFPNDELNDIILLKKGDICLQEGLWDEGYYSLRMIWRQYPKSRFIPQARYVYAAGLEKVGRYQEALSMYSFIRNNYPMSYWEKASDKRIQYIRTFVSKKYNRGLLKLSEYITGEENFPTDLLELGRIYFYDFKNYEKTVALLKPGISRNSITESTAEIYFLLGESYLNLFKYENKNSNLDSAYYYHMQNIKNISSSVFRKKSCIALAKLQNKFSLPELYKLIRTCSGKNIKDSLDYELQLLKADILVQLDSLNRALQYYKKISKNTLFSQNKEIALYMSAKINYMLNSPVNADSLFTLYRTRYIKGNFLPAVLFYQARMKRNSENYQACIDNYQKILNTFFYSSFNDSANKYLGSIYLQTGNYKKAIQHFNEILRQDSILHTAFSAGLLEEKGNDINKMTFLFKLARSYEMNKDFNKAQAAYLQYGKYVSAPKDKIKYYAALSTVAEQRSDTLRAIEYLKHLFTVKPNDTIAAALGSLYLKKKDYQAAREIFTRGINISNSDSIKCYLNANIIISLLREHKIPQADVRINIFDQSFKHLDCREKYQNEFYLEKGIAYIEEKEFDDALKFLKKINNRKEFQHLFLRAQFQIGRVYLITNKVEKALDILTSLIENYKEHPISYKVYLNLGYHYFRSQQYQNAIHALKTASDSPDNSIRKTSLRILIKIYEENGLTDNALKITRDYIEEFSDADDILQQKIKIGTLLMQLHEYDRAIEHLKSLKIFSDSESEARIQYWIAKSYYNMGQFKKSIFEFLKVKYLSQSTKLPWKTTAMYEASNAYIKLQEYDHAADLLKRIIQIEGTTSSMGRFAVEKLQEIKTKQQ